MVPPPEDVSLGELSRSLAGAVARFEGLARRLEDGQFVRTDLFNTYRDGVNTALGALERRAAQLEDDKANANDILHLKSRVDQLEDDKKWLIRLVIGFVILGVVGAAIASGSFMQ